MGKSHIVPAQPGGQAQCAADVIRGTTGEVVSRSRMHVPPLTHCSSQRGSVRVLHVSPSNMLINILSIFLKNICYIYALKIKSCC